MNSRRLHHDERAHAKSTRGRGRRGAGRGRTRRGAPCSRGATRCRPGVRPGRGSRSGRPRSAGSRRRPRRRGLAARAAPRSRRVVEALVRERDHEPGVAGPLDQVGERRPGLRGGGCRRSFACGSRPACRRCRSARARPSERASPTRGSSRDRSAGCTAGRRTPGRCRPAPAASSFASARATAPGRPGDGRRLAQLERVCSPWRPPLQVGHLHADGGVDPVGGFDQAREEDAALDKVEVEPVDLVADRVDPHPVLGLEVARPAAERLGDVAVDRRQPAQVPQEPLDADAVDVRAGGDVRKAEGLGVRGGVVREHLDPRSPERLPDSGRPGEEVGRRARPELRCGGRDRAGERALGAQVLDHGRDTTAGDGWGSV